MKRGLIGVITAGLALASMAQCRAAVFTYDLQSFATPWTTPPGVNSTQPGFTNFLAPPVVNPATLSTSPGGTVLVYGLDTQFSIFSPNVTASYLAAPVDFNYAFTNNSPGSVVTDDFHVTGFLNGNVGFTSGAGFSTATVTFGTVTDLTSGATWFSGIDPNDHQAALVVSENIGGTPYTIYLDKIQDVPNPTQLQISIQGFVTGNAVPEPGALALLIAAGVTGSFVLVRRRRTV